jgi:RNA polymerase sigma factor (TIGR02999 family)
MSTSAAAQTTSAARSASAERETAKKLFPLVYQELRKAAARCLAQEWDGHTFQPTALVHEAYLRLAGGATSPQQFDGPGHFYAAAAEAMRRILVDYARRRNALKRGGQRQHRPLDSDLIACPSDVKPIDDLLALDDALTKLAGEDPRKAELVKLRYFAGLTLGQAAKALGISRNTADRWWQYAKAFMYHEITSPNSA